MNPGASASPAGKTFLLTTTTVSIVWAGRRRAELVGDPRPERPDVSEVEPQREGILVSRAGRRVEVVPDERHVSAAARRVDADPHQGEGRVGLRLDPPVPLPATIALEARGIAGAGGLVAAGEE